ncbi:MAG: bacteriohemerythrin [Pseudomonadota bacterium]
MSTEKPLPEWLYQPLPFIYLTGGGVVGYALPNLIGWISAAMLVSAGVVVWTLRVRYRRAMRSLAARPHRGHEADLRPRPAGLVTLVWHAGYECGHPLIDAQHRRLFEYGNELLNAILANQSKLDVELQLDELIAHVESHFCEEEALMARGQLPASDGHRQAHRRLLDQARLLSARFHRGEVGVGEIFAFIANDVITQHILGDDQALIGKSGG